MVENKTRSSEAKMRIKTNPNIGDVRWSVKKENMKKKILNLKLGRLKFEWESS